MDELNCLKFIIIGDSGTGKSSIRTRFMDNRFSYEIEHTVGVEFGKKALNVGDKLCVLRIWDTAGQERFRALSRAYYRGAHGCILVYDITNRESYNSIVTWLNAARSQAGPDTVVLLAGNKSDLQEDREVTFLEASRWAQENGLLFLETSAKTGDGIEEAFVMCSKLILSRIEDGYFENNSRNLSLNTPPPASSSSCSC